MIGNDNDKQANSVVKGREPISAAALASQPAAGHSLSFYYYTLQNTVFGDFGLRDVFR